MLHNRRSRTGGPGSVSIAGAILWGVLRRPGRSRSTGPGRFNRRGDSLGGAAPPGKPRIYLQLVSIAGAILWGVLRGSAACRIAESQVSIAGAILWGVLRSHFRPVIQLAPVSIAGAILWGVLPTCCTWTRLTRPFQSQGRFFGGCCPPLPPC